MEEIKLTQAGQLECDFEGAKARLEEQIAPYRNVVFTEDTKKDAKELVAQLRKDQKAFDAEVKAIKKEYMKPFDEFFAKAKELLGMYDEPISSISNQIDAFEMKRKQEQEEAVKAVYAELVPETEIAEIIPFAKIFNPKWLNATTTQKSIREEIMQRKEEAKTAVETIKGFNSDKEEQALNMYRTNLNLTECIHYLQQYEQQKKEIEEQQRERIKREEEERIRREERAKLEAEQRAQEEAERAEQEKAQAVEQAKAETIEAFIPEETEDEAVEYSYTIKLTADAKNKLEMFMDSIGIEYEEIVF